MKKKSIILSLILMVVAFSFLNSNSKETNDVGYVAIACYSASDGGSDAGYLTAGNVATCAFGGCAVKAGIAIAASTNPVGWVIGGVVCAA